MKASVALILLAGTAAVVPAAAATTTNDDLNKKDINNNNHHISTNNNNNIVPSSLTRPVKRRRSLQPIDRRLWKYFFANNGSGGAIPDGVNSDNPPTNYGTTTTNDNDNGTTGRRPWTGAFKQSPQQTNQPTKVRNHTLTY